MSHLIEKHQQNNKGRGVITFSPEQIAEFEKRQTPTRMFSDTTSEPARRNKQKLLINEENTLSKRIQRTSGLYKQGKTTPKTAWYSRVTPLVNTDPSGGYHAYNAEQFFKDQTGEEMPTILRPTASDNIRVGMTAPMVLGFGAGAAQPLAMMSGIGQGLMYGGAWDLGSRLFTGKSWANNVSDWTGMPEDLAFSTNPGMLIGGTVGPYRARVSIYNNKNPFGYGNQSSKITGIKPALTEIKQGIIDWFHPFRSWKPKETPYWKAVLLSGTNKNKSFSGDMTFGSAAEFRDMMFRKALQLPENKNGTVFVDNGDGTFGVNMDKVNAIRRQWGGSNYNGTMKVIEGTNKRVAPHNYSFLSGDNIVGVGGFTNGKTVFDPVTGKATGTMTDVWDIHPFSDERTIWKWGSLHLPWLRKWEAMTAFGGENPTVKITIPNARTQVIHNNTPKSVNTSQYKQYDL